MRDKASTLDALVVIDDGSAVTLQTRDQMAFGRETGDGVVGIAPNDTGVSRRAGRLAFRSETWRVENLSETKDLFVEYPEVVEWATVPPRSSHTLTGTATLLVVGHVFTHAVRITLSSSYAAQFVVTASETGETNDDRLYSDDDKTALAALAVGYLRRWPHHEPWPRPYSEAGALIGWDPVTLRRRLENLRDRLRDNGVAYLYGTHSARLLTEFAIRQGVIGVTDLSRLGGAARETA